MPETVLDNAYATLFYYPREGIVHHLAKQYLYGEVLQTLLLTGARLMKERGGTKWLSDDSLHAAMLEKDAKWVRTVWFPKAEAAGWEYWAVVPPKKVVGRMNMGRIEEILRNLGITVEAFDNADDALIWLRSR